MLVLLTGFFTLVVVALLFIANPDDTTSLTNIGFAIFAALASVCFGWSRALDNNKELNRTQNIVASGELFLFSGIMFLFASATKYVSMHLTDIGKTILASVVDPEICKQVLICLKLSNVLSIGLALWTSSKALLRILPTLIVKAYPHGEEEN
jgi:hypothetical protein